MRTITSIGIFLMLWACVDRIHFAIEKSTNYGISIDGIITDQPGPYQVRVNRTFDIESIASTKTPISVKHLILSDNAGTSEELSQISSGVYETSAMGIHGQVGKVYTLRIELLDGEIFESVPDTLLPAGKMDSVFYAHSNKVNLEGALENGFDIFFSASRGEGGNRFMWRMTGTYQAETRPECDNLNCYFLDDRCNYSPACSGLKNIGTSRFPQFIRVAPCSCCTCWYQLFSTKPLLSDENLSASQRYIGIPIYHVPITPWIFAHKIHVEVSQSSLTTNTFRFWKAVRDQQNAIGSIFQPVTGKIPVNFVQISGSQTPIQGLFYATAIRSKALYITRDNVPHPETLPTLEQLFATPPGTIGCTSCLLAFPNSTNIKPSFWKD